MFRQLALITYKFYLFLNLSKYRRWIKKKKPIVNDKGVWRQTARRGRTGGYLYLFIRLISTLFRIDHI